MLTHTHAVLILDCGQGAVADAAGGHHVALLWVTDAPAVLGEHEAQLEGASLTIPVFVDVEAALDRTHAAVIVQQNKAFLQRTHWDCCGVRERQRTGFRHVQYCTNYSPLTLT